MNNRKYKFRLWDGKQMHLSYVVGGYAFSDAIQVRNEPFIPGQTWELMQYTGIKDTEGVEIFEGDIVKWGHRAAVIVWLDTYENIGWYLGFNSESYKDGGYYERGTYKDITKQINNIEIIADEPMCEPNFAKYEVVGNIWENPEIIQSAIQPISFTYDVKCQECGKTFQVTRNYPIPEEKIKQGGFCVNCDDVNK